ncbi:MAG: sensor histidine kinase [Clostridia bacterium]|nr:sensor histidine kinase [Clostridia bacterium]
MRNPFNYLVRKWKSFYSRSSIQLILSLSFTASAVMGMIFLGLALFFRLSVTSNDQMAENSSRIMAQVNLNMDSYLRRMMSISDTMYYRVIKNADFATDSIDNELALIYENGGNSLISIALFTGDGELLSATPLTALKDGANASDESWFVSAMNRIENLHFSTPHVQNLFDDPDNRYRWVVSLSRYVEITRNGITEGGVLLVDMSFSGIEQICEDVLLSNSDSYLYLIDGNGEIIFHPRQQLIYAGLLDENNLVAAGYADGSHVESFNGNRRQVSVRTVGYTGWKLVGVAYESGITSYYGQLLLFFLFVILFSIFLLVFLNLRMSERISVPIKSLDKAVKALQAGQEDVNFDVSGPYEIEYLGNSIRSLVMTMRKLMDDVVEKEAQKRRSELDVLQSQINPHFLYNTLDSVVWMTESGRTEEAVVMITSLARFFRLSLSGGYSVIPIADELEHAKYYLTIQQMRYKNKFETEITMAPELKELFTIKLIVQPILENAIYHGVSVGDGDGKITVNAFLEENDVIIEIADNGSGMPPETVSRLLDESYEPAPATEGSGIGLKNVHRRIRLAFGDEYGVSIFSEPDVGTTVRIKLPKLYGRDAQGAKRSETNETN